MKRSIFNMTVFTCKKSLLLLIVLFHGDIISCTESEEYSRRFILDTPDATDRLVQLEKTVAELSATVKQQSDDIRHKGELIPHLTTEMQQQISQIQLLTTDYQQLVSKQAQMALEVHNQGVEIQHQSVLINHLTTENQQFASSIGILTTENQQMTSELKQIQLQMQSISHKSGNVGTTYIRWGRKDCPTNSSELVYSGYGGGGKYDESGSAAEYICLPPDPNFGTSTGGDRGRVYGAEYNSNFFGDIHSGSRDVPCAVCRTLEASSVMMIPGKNQCYPGWTTEYSGYLASNDHTWAAAGSYACVDNDIQFTTDDFATDVTEYGKLFLEVVAKCGSLHCPPYKNNVPLTCVVCSK